MTPYLTRLLTTRQKRTTPIIISKEKEGEKDDGERNRRDWRVHENLNNLTWYIKKERKEKIKTLEDTRWQKGWTNPRYNDQKYKRASNSGKKHEV